MKIFGNQLNAGACIIYILFSLLSISHIPYCEILNRFHNMELLKLTLYSELIQDLLQKTF